MGSAPVSEPVYVADTVTTAVKILVVGHFAVGKTTLSEHSPRSGRCAPKRR